MVATLMLTSCMKDDMDDCALLLQLRFVYNMQQIDGFSRAANHVCVSVFDADKKWVADYEADNIYGQQNFTMRLPMLDPGRYTFVVRANGTEETHPMADFAWTKLQTGSSPDDLQGRLPRNDDGVVNHRLNNLLVGVQETEISGASSTITINMLKCTNQLRVILMPAQASQSLKSEDFDIRIEGSSGWLAYDGSIYQSDSVTYHPYVQVLESDPSQSRAGAEIDHAVVADLSTSRIMDGSNSRLVIYHRTTQSEVLNINLPWFLSLQAIGEHQATWSNQEYLDRQSEFAMTFFIDGSTWMHTRIIVNGWVLSLQDIGL